jgi:hypothetical protein
MDKNIAFIKGELHPIIQRSSVSIRHRYDILMDFKEEWIEPGYSKSMAKKEFDSWK